MINHLIRKNVDKLWNQVKDFKPVANGIQISGVSLLSKIVEVGSDYTIVGEEVLKLVIR